MSPFRINNHKHEYIDYQIVVDFTTLVYRLEIYIFSIKGLETHGLCSFAVRDFDIDDYLGWNSLNRFVM